MIPRPALGFWLLIHRSALGFVADQGFLPSKEAPSGEGGCGHGIVKLALVTMVHVIIQRKRRRGHGEVHGGPRVPASGGGGPAMSEGGCGHGIVI